MVLPEKLKTSIFIILLLSMGHTSMPQTFFIGANYGLGRSTIKDEFHWDINQIFNYQDSKYWSHQAELSVEYYPIIQFGSVFSGISFHTKGGPFKLKYFTIPVIARIYLISLDVFKLYIGPGIYSSILLNYDNNISQRFNDTKSTFEFGLIINAGIRFRINQSLYIYSEFRNYVALTNLYTDKYRSYDVQCRSRNYIILWGLAYNISKTK
jgi:hypothetical protein